MGGCVSIRKNEHNHELLNKLYPKHIKKYLLEAINFDFNKTIDKHNNVIVIFIDICGFTRLSLDSEPENVARFLHCIYFRIDTILDMYPLLQKIETIGDCIMISSGLYTDKLTKEHFDSSFDFCIKVNKTISKLKYKNKKILLRTGIHVGPIVSGIVGKNVPRFCLFGSAINIASRLQTSAEAGEIHVSSEYMTNISVDMKHNFANENTNNINFIVKEVDLKNLNRMTTYSTEIICSEVSTEMRNVEDL